MRIAILGNGAMASLFGAFLSKSNDVTLIGRDRHKLELLSKNGLLIRELATDMHFPVKVAVSGEYEGEADLVLLFVNGYATKEMLQDNKNIIGKNTYVLSLQIGAGHAKEMKEFVALDHILLGTTLHGATMLGLGAVNHSTRGMTTIGRYDGGKEGLEDVAKAFSSSGFEIEISSNVRQAIWAKLLNNSTISATTAILQCPLEYLAINSYAWDIVKGLLREAIMTAKLEGYFFDGEDVEKELREVCENSRYGYTTMYSDVAAGRTCEIDYICGYISQKAHEKGLSTPMMDMAVLTVHALEGKHGLYA